MVFDYTDEQLNSLNHGQHVYSVNPEFAQRKENRKDIVIAKSDNELQKGETNTLTTPDGQQFQVVATRSDPETGFDGLAVAPIVNGQPDYSSVAVVAAGTDPNSPVNQVGPISRDVVSAIEARQSGLSPQYMVAEQFVKEVKDDPKYEVTQLSGYSQGAYMLKVGAKYHIPTTTFNAWFKYGALTDAELDFMEKNPAMFIDYRLKNDDVVQYNDFNHPEWLINRIYNPNLRTIYWLEGTSHKITDWKFDSKTGLVIDPQTGKVLRTQAHTSYIDSVRAMSHYKSLKTRWANNGFSSSEQIYLDAAQGQILSSSMATAANTASADLGRLVEESNTAIEELWGKIDFTNYSALSYDEVEAIFASQGVTRERYVDDFVTETSQNLHKMQDIAVSFQSLDNQIQAAIEKILATDTQLAREFQEWKAEM